MKPSREASSSSCAPGVKRAELRVGSSPGRHPQASSQQASRPTHSCPYPSPHSCLRAEARSARRAATRMIRGCMDPPFLQNGAVSLIPRSPPPLHYAEEAGPGRARGRKTKVIWRPKGFYSLGIWGNQSRKEGRDRASPCQAV